MRQLYLSDSGPKVSEAVYSFHRWSSGSPGSVGEMERIVSLCLDLGLNTFDHADHYGDYTCEENFGLLLAKKIFKRENVVIFTKCGYRYPHKSTPDVRVPHYDTSAKHIERSVDLSLKRLRTDYIDIFLLDHLDPISNLEETALALEKLLRGGKVQHIGVANFTVFQHQLLTSYLHVPVVTHHLELNLLNTAALDNGQLDYIKQRYIHPIVSFPVAEGRIVSGTDDAAVRVRKKLNEISPRYEADIESLAVAWLRRLGALPLVGTRDEQRIKNIVHAYDIELVHEDWYELYNASKGIL